jgi:hypothetical protein
VGGTNLEGAMTKREAAIVSAYTGYLVGSFLDVQEYASDLIGHPLWAHEFGDKRLAAELHEKSRPDFVALTVI